MHKAVAPNNDGTYSDAGSQRSGFSYHSAQEFINPLQGPGEENVMRFNAIMENDKEEDDDDEARRSASEPTTPVNIELAPVNPRSPSRA